MVNGIFYPEGEAALTNLLISWGLKKGLPVQGGQTIVVPHGAWDLTGSIAASAFAGVQKNGGDSDIGRVLLLGTCHQSNEDGIYLSESDFFETPLGDLEVDQSLNRKLSSCSTLICINDIHIFPNIPLRFNFPWLSFVFPTHRLSRY